MQPEVSNAVSAAIRSLLRPLVRLLLRNGVPYRGFADIAKSVYVEVATKEFTLPERKQSKSRVSIITGLSRKEVLRVERLPEADDRGAVERYNRAARVISGWVRDGAYRDDSGRPRDLPVEGEEGSFARLVRTYSGDAPARAVLDELLRVGAVARTPEGTVRLLGRSYVPRTSEIDKIGILGVDVSDLIATIDHNIRRPDDPFYQRKVCYDNLPFDVIPELKDHAREKTQELLEHLDGWMSARDRDANPQVAGRGRARAGVGIYFFLDEYDEGKER